MDVRFYFQFTTKTPKTRLPDSFWLLSPAPAHGRQRDHKHTGSSRLIKGGRGRSACTILYHIEHRAVGNGGGVCRARRSGMQRNHEHADAQEAIPQSGIRLLSKEVGNQGQLKVPHAMRSPTSFLCDLQMQALNGGQLAADFHTEDLAELVNILHHVRAPHKYLKRATLSQKPPTLVAKAGEQAP